MTLLEDLNENQKEAVLRTEGPLLILAGAGSGKTRVITYRIAHLVLDKGVRPYTILAVTFTNKAAGEMKTRVINLIGTGGESVFIRTFHSAAVFILRRYGENAGIPRTFSIYDQRDQETLIKEILVDMRLDPKKVKPGMIASRISQIKDSPEFFSGGNIDSLFPKNLPFNFKEIFNTYHRKMENLYALDFNDLLIKTTILLRDCPQVLEELQRKWKYFMIDEYQDTNHAQYLISRYLSSASRNICVVGDDDQSIYSWRGADIRNILDFEKDYKDAHVVTLEENYRSTTPILQAASSVIANNEHRKEKNLRAWKGDGEPIIWCRAGNEFAESEYVINKIISFKQREGLKNSDFAVFYRTNAQSRVFEDYLRRENIPYRVVGGLRFYDRKEVKDILSYLRVTVNPHDSISLRRVINTPARGIGDTTINRLSAAASDQGLTLWQAVDRELPIEGRAPKGLTQFRDLMRQFRALSADVPAGIKLSDFVSDIIIKSGYRKSLTDEDTIESRGRLENINEFINSVYDYEGMNREAGLDEFLQDISLLTSVEDPEGVPDESGTVTLMTVHIAKGLEFPVVFLTGMEDGLFPHANSIDTQAQLEEERRLCYVGITRAKDRVFLTSAEIRRSFGEISYRLPSRFISEIPEHLLETTEHFSDSYTSSNYQYRNSFHDRNNNRDNKKSPEPDIEKPAADSAFRRGDRVSHPSYGTGTILSISGKGDNVKLSIRFPGATKSFLEKYSHLKKI